MDLNEQMSDTMNSTKSCSDCHTTQTPLWRSGPSGPKSMCNACGIKYNKKRRALLGLNTGRKNKKKSGKGLMKQKKSEMGRSWKLRLVTMGGGEMILQPEHKIRRGGGGEELREEEQAAVLLMALSCGLPMFRTDQMTH